MRPAGLRPSPLVRVTSPAHGGDPCMPPGARTPIAVWMMPRTNPPSPGYADPPWRRLFAVFVGLHGLAHLAGAGDLLNRARDDRAAHLLAHTVTVSDPATVSALGVVVPLASVGYLAAAVAIWQLPGGRPVLLPAVTLASLVVVLTLW